MVWTGLILLYITENLENSRFSTNRVRRAFGNSTYKIYTWKGGGRWSIRVCVVCAHVHVCHGRKARRKAHRAALALRVAGNGGLMADDGIMHTRRRCRRLPAWRV